MRDYLTVFKRGVKINKIGIMGGMPDFVSLKTMITQEKVLDALRNVDDPDLKKDIVTLGMVRDIVIEGKNVSFRVVLTTPACPLKDTIRRACENAIIHLVDKDAIVNVKMDAEVTSHRQGKNEILPNVRNIIAVASGKGGVGKSTIAANLAVGLVKLGAKVGLVDADIYGPSQAIMFDVVNEKPMMTQVNGHNKMVPVESYGVKILSIGFFATANQAVAWRGPMASRALQQLFTDTEWEILDYMIVDLPPGTGDIHLSLVQNFPITGVVIVTTPQDVALADARKGIAMFRMNGINVPVLGLVENMSWFTPAELPNNKYYIFGRDGGKHLAEELGIPLLGQIPLVQSIRESGDAGRPAILQENTSQSIAFMEMVHKTAQQIAIVNAGRKHTEAVV